MQCGCVYIKYIQKQSESVKVPHHFCKLCIVRYSQQALEDLTLVITVRSLGKGQG